MIINNNILLLVSFLIGSILTIFFVGYDNIGFTDVKWFTEYDTISDFLALKFFLQDEWRFPLGLNSSYGELKNSIVFSGAVPILSLITKVFKNFLPYNFHYFIIWIVICFSLHIFFAYKVIFSLTKNINFSIISSLFFLFNPILIQKMSIHLSLGAHWLIIAYIYLEIESNIKFKKAFQIALILFSSLIHFYLTVMILIMHFIFSTTNYFKNKKFRLYFIENFKVFFPLLLCMYIVGYFSIPTSDSLGFGYGVYKANILTFFDPSPNSNLNSWSFFLPNIKNTRGEYEGFGYLGLGLIILNFFLVFYLLKNFTGVIKKNIQYVLIFIIFMLIAFTTTVNVGSIKILDLKLPIFLYAPLSIIRASGRFIWPVYYLLIIFSLFAFYKLKVKFRYLIIILLIQFIDLTPGINNFYNPTLEGQNSKLNDPIWNNINKNFDKIKTTKISNSSNVFVKISSLMIDKSYSETNIARLGRYNRKEASNLRTKLYSDLIKKDVDLKTIYIIDNLDHLRHLKFLYQDSNHGLLYRDKMWILLPNLKKNMIRKDEINLKKIKYLDVQLDKIYPIEHNINSGILGFGWSHASYGRNLSSEGAWTEGHAASLLFNRSKTIKINSIILHFEKSINIQNKPLLVDVFLNDIFFKTLNLINQKNLKVILDTSEINFINEVNIINFKIKNPVRPISKLESVDGRLLGFLIKDIEFR